jgi:UPF0716 family protein affecting phage T7 exclusion
MAKLIENGFWLAFVLLFGGLGISNFVAMKQEQQEGDLPYRGYFALLYIVIAAGLLIYKLNNP